MNVAGLINSFLTGTYTLTRTTAGTYTAGRFVAGTATTSTIRACVQPLRGRDLLSLPEGRRGDDTRVVYTTTLLRVVTPSGAADKVTIDGEVFEVVHVAPWNEPQSDTYCRALVARTTPTGGP